MKSQNFPGFVAEGSLFQSLNQYIVKRSTTFKINSSISPADEQMLEEYTTDYAKASCLSGDGAHLCHCPRNCAASQTRCNCY